MKGTMSFTGMNKDEARKKFWESQVQIWRRSYDMPPPGGESLKNTLKGCCPTLINISIQD